MPRGPARTDTARLTTDGSGRVASSLGSPGGAASTTPRGTTPRPPPAHQTGKICYLEIPARDVHESVAFYETAFDWNIRSRETDRPSFDDTTGQVSGAFVRNRTPDADPGILTYIMVASAAAAADRVVAAGGSIVLPVGRYETEVLATFLDPAGNLLGIYRQPGLAEAEAGT